MLNFIPPRSEDDVLNLMMEADLDGSGTIEFPEFLELMKQKLNSLYL